MKKKLTSAQKKQQLNRLFAKYNQRLGMLYSSYVKKLTSLGYGDDVFESDALFNFDNFPDLKARLNKIFEDYFQSSLLCYESGITDGVSLAYTHDNDAIGKYTILSDKALQTARKTAAATFIANRLNSSKGLNLAQTVWNYCSQTKSEFEMAMSNAIADGLSKGTSAEEIGKQIRKYLNNPDMMYRRYHTIKVQKNGKKKDVVTWRRRRIIDGKVRFVEEPLEKVGMGVYRSARKNALRVARTEINNAYLNAHNERWANEPFVIGQHIHLSPQHDPEKGADICDELEGYYPKDFKWSGWHPQCYTEEAQVLTRNGWKYFKDVLDKDEILSLNPNTKEIEYTQIKRKQKYLYKGNLLRFHNKFLECVVTPEHQMVYLSKDKRRAIKRCSALEYSMTKGAFYRAANNTGKDIDTIMFGDKLVPFDLFCEFMGYYLADGSMMRDSGVVISQKREEPAWEKIQNCIKLLGFNPHVLENTITIYHKAFGVYLKQFGKAHDKFIPNEILTASKRQIQIFLDAFILCDGHTRNPKMFVGNRGNLFVGKNFERLYYTVSPQMAADLCVLMLQIGHRPSYKIQECKKSVKKDGTVIKSNYPCYRINECYSATASVFKKEYVSYNGYVYDLTLEKNHIMYIQMHGKCFWGSNCMCTSDPVMISGEEKEQFYNRLYAGEDMSNYVSPNRIKDVPNQYKRYIEQNADNIVNAYKRDKLAWHLDNNKKFWTGLLNKEQREVLGLTSQEDIRKAILDKAKLRHSKRTQEQIDKIQAKWHNHRRKLYNDRVKSLIGTEYISDKIKGSLFERYYAGREAILEGKSVSELNAIFNRFEHGWHIKQTWTDRKVAINVIKVAQKYGGTDITAVQAALDNADYARAKQEAKKLAKAIAAIQKDEAELSKLIPDVNTWHKQFTSEQLHGVYDAVESKLSQWSGLTLEQKQKKLHFEAYDFLGGNMHGVQQKYATWQVSQSAYLKELANVENAIEEVKINDALPDVYSYKTQSKIYHKLIYDLKNAIAANDKNLAQNLLDKAKDKKEQLINAKSKRLSGKSALFDKDVYSQARKDAAVWDKGNGKLADDTLHDTAGAAWRAATELEKDKVYEYTYHYCNVNEPLQGRIYIGSQTKSEFIERVDNITSYINKNELPKDMWFTRGDDGLGVIESRIKFAGGAMPTDLQDLVGMTMQEGGFMPTGSRKGKGFGHKSVILNIYAPKGTKAAYIEPISDFGEGAKRGWDGIEKFSTYSTEHETLFQRGTKMRITKVYNVGEQTFIDCEVIGQELKDLSYIGDNAIGY